MLTCKTGWDNSHALSGISTWHRQQAHLQAATGCVIGTQIAHWPFLRYMLSWLHLRARGPHWLASRRRMGSWLAALPLCATLSTLPCCAPVRG